MIIRYEVLRTGRRLSTRRVRSCSPSASQAEDARPEVGQQANAKVQHAVDPIVCHDASSPDTIVQAGLCGTSLCRVTLPQHVPARHSQGSLVLGCIVSWALLLLMVLERETASPSSGNFTSPQMESTFEHDAAGQVQW